MALIQHAQLCDIEIIENRLYFYWRDYPESQQDIEDKFQTVQGVLKKVGDKLAHDDIFAVPSQARLHIELGQSVKIKAPGFSLIGALKWWLMWDKLIGRYLARRARAKLKKQLAETYGELAKQSN